MTRALLLIVAFCCGSPTLAYAGYTSLFAFGDSLMDSGNAFAISGGTWPPSPPYAQRFSNGPVAVEYLAGHLGIPLAPSELGGTNYAVGGATTGTRNYSFEIGDPPGLPATLENTGLLTQVGSFTAAPPSFDPATSLFMVWAGSNDFFLAFAEGENLATTLENAVTNIATAVGLLAAAGGDDLLVLNMPNLALTPFGLAQSPEVQAAMAAVSIAFNAALAEALDAVRDDALIDLMMFDVAGLVESLAADPAAFGFTNVTEPCIAAGPAVVAAGCPGFLFFDEVHPTTAAHSLLGGLLFAQLPQQVPEPAAWSLLVLALAAAWATTGRRRRSTPRLA